MTPQTKAAGQLRRHVARRHQLLSFVNGNRALALLVGRTAKLLGILFDFVIRDKSAGPLIALCCLLCEKVVQLLLIPDRIRHRVAVLAVMIEDQEPWYVANDLLHERGLSPAATPAHNDDPILPFHSCTPSIQ